MRHKESESKKIKEMEIKISELVSGWQRTQADFLNFKKQTDIERSSLIKNANSNLVYELLPILDNFRLAAKHVPKELESNNWVMGIRQIEKQFEDTLSAIGLEKISSLGEHFNPMLHEAIDHVKSEKPEGEIVEEVLSGYKFKDEVIRPSRVKVSAGR